jgi:hypothetical protein
MTPSEELPVVPAPTDGVQRRARLLQTCCPFARTAHSSNLDRSSEASSGPRRTPERYESRFDRGGEFFYEL